MSNQRLEFLEAERATLHGLLDELSDDQSLGRISLQHRLEEVEAELRAMASQRSHSADVVLVFGGEPVFGSSAIDAEFAANALGRFQKLVATINAERTRGTLGSRGAIPAKSHAKLLITGTVTGSFGFRLEERQSFLIESHAEAALDRAMFLFAAAQADDASFASAIVETDHRVGMALRDFLLGVEAGEAAVAITSRTARVKMTSDDVRDASRRAKSLRLEQKHLWRKGTLSGVFMGARTYEFTFKDGALVSGRFSDDVDVPSVGKLMGKSGNGYFFRVRTRTPTGGVAERYTMLSFEPE